MNPYMQAQQGGSSPHLNAGGSNLNALSQQQQQGGSSPNLAGGYGSPYGGQPQQPYPQQGYQGAPPQQPGGYSGYPNPSPGGYPGSPYPNHQNYAPQPNPQGGAPATSSYPQQTNPPPGTSPHPQQGSAPGSPYPQQGGYGAPPQQGYPSQQQGSAPGSPYPQQGYPSNQPNPSQPPPGTSPHQGSAPGSPYPQQGGYGAPPQQGYPSQQQGYPSQQAGYPPQQGLSPNSPYPGSPAPGSPYPQQGGYGSPYPQQGAYAPPQQQCPTDHKLFMVSIVVQQGRQLASMDSNGKSDPYVNIITGSQTIYKTKVVHKSLNPVWAQNYTLTQANIGPHTEIRFDVYDHDLVGAHDYMGSVLVPLSSLPFDHLVQKWYPISDLSHKNHSHSKRKLTGELHLYLTKQSQYFGRPPQSANSQPNPAFQSPNPNQNQGLGLAPVQRGLEAPGASGLKFFQHVQSSSSHNSGGHGAQLSRDFILVVDKSGSMAGNLWKEAHKAVTILAPYVVRADPDGITIYFFSGGSHFAKYERVRDEETVQKAFSKESPGGTTNLAGVLHVALKEAEKNLKQHGKQTTVLVITDGEPDDRHAVKKEIKKAANHLERDEDLSISFIQIGNDKSAKKFLEELDDEKYSKFDIVDTMTFEKMANTSFSDFIRMSIGD